MKDEGLADVPLVVGGIIPPADEKLLLEEGVAAVYTPKNYDLNAIMADIVRVVESTRGAVADREARPAAIEASDVLTRTVGRLCIL